MRYLDKLPSSLRKQFPMYSGLKAYFPDALAFVSFVSWVGNQKHNPGQPLHWDRGKSMDHLDCIERHMDTVNEWETISLQEVGYDVVVPHRAYVAWRALAELQMWMEKEFNLSPPPNAVDPDEPA